MPSSITAPSTTAPSSITIDPFTRIEGHLKIKIEVEDGRIARAFSSGEMFRGFEQILVGRDPMDAQQITQRICGVCPVSHGIASILAQDQAYGVTPPKNGRIIRNIIQGANYIQSHILHFYHLAALDFVDITAVLQYTGRDRALLDLKGWVASEQKNSSGHPVAPFLPRYKGEYLKDTKLNIGAIRHYLEALEMRRLAHEMLALFGGKAPHAASLVPGGVTEQVTIDKMAACSWKLKKLREFIDYTYLPDVVAVASAFPEYFRVGRGCGNFLAYGVFPESDRGEDHLLPSGVILNGEPEPFHQTRITEDVRYSYFTSASGLHPARGETDPSFPKEEAYSWLKAPRYQKQVMEVGPLARVMVAYLKGGNSQVVGLVDALLSKLGRKADDLVSVLGRHAARAIECKVVADRCSQWLEELYIGQSAFEDYNLPKEASGVGLTEAPRGALGHWLEIDNYKIKRYQCVVPTTWNCSPRDEKGTPGAVEQALQGTTIADRDNPIEAARIVRSFDPCLACAVH